MEDIKNKKILMALMSFSIGGAETHVLELSGELKKKGFDVVLISGGGVYEEVLKEMGIKHYTAPLYTKNPLQVIKSLKILKRVIKEEKIDIVHAHGRIPAFLCSILHKTMDFVFVTTAHWVFTTKYGLKYISKWGKKTVAVSEDIKKYLMENYNTNPMDIFVTINGIDTEKFSQNADFSSVMTEFDLSGDTRKIVYISRMDEDRAEVAFRLLNIAPELSSLYDDIEIVIVGGGNVYDKIELKAKEVNEKVGKRLVTLAGARTDIYKFAAMSDLFIGVSRAALEAMACAKPVIVAGNEGYIGIFDKDKLDVCIDTNFCCRGCELSSDERLLKDVCYLLSADSEEIKRLSAYSRETILDSYSVSKMADDNIRMYKAAVDKYEYDAVISGYYGFENSGDEALLCGIIDNLRKSDEDIKICVLSKSPKDTAEKYGVHSVNRYNFFKVSKILKKSRLFISGGGSLLQDVTSSKSLWYYISMIKLAKSKGVPVMVYANGIGPIEKQFNKKLAIRALELAKKITLREDGSYMFLKDMGIDMSKVEITADPALLIEPISKKEAIAILEKEGISADKKCIGISVRNWKTEGADFEENISAALCDICKKYDLFPVFFPLKQPEDIEISHRIAKRLDVESKVLECKYSAPEIIGIVGEMELMLCMRLHAVIYAAVRAVPSVNISYDPKVSNMASYLGLGDSMEIPTLTKEDLTNQLSDIIENKDKIKNELFLKCNEFKEKAEKDALFAFELIKGRN